MGIRNRLCVISGAVGLEDDLIVSDVTERVDAMSFL